MAEITKDAVKQIAKTAEADAGTVYRYLAGVPVRPLARTRIERALRALGLESRIHQAEQAAE